MALARLDRATAEITPRSGDVNIISTVRGTTATGQLRRFHHRRRLNSPAGWLNAALTRRCFQVDKLGPISCFRLGYGKAKARHALGDDATRSGCFSATGGRS